MDNIVVVVLRILALYWLVNALVLVAGFYVDFQSVKAQHLIGLAIFFGVAAGLYFCAGPVRGW